MKYEIKNVLLVLVISLFAGIIIRCSAENFVDNEGRSIQLVSLENRKNRNGTNDSGDCGPSVHWSFESNTGILTIYGTGRMDDFAYNASSHSYSSPFYIYKDFISSVIIEMNVTSIGSLAFVGCSKLTSIIIPDSVSSIGGNAFYECKQLASINIPNSVTSIGGMVFYYCNKLTSINIPNSVTSIGNLTFLGCEGLQSITIPDSVTSIGSYAFDGCINLTSINIPNSVTSIGNHAFSRCSKLQSISIPDSVTSIGSYAFNGCDELKSVFYQGNTFISSSIFYSTSLQNLSICVSPDYNYTSFGGRNVTSSAPDCTTFRKLFNKCYMGAYIDDEFTRVKREEFIVFEKQRNGCIERTCDDDIGLVTWSVCNSTESKTLVCINDQCVESKDVDNRKWIVEIVIEMKAVDLNLAEVVVIILSLPGVDTDDVGVGTEVDASGNVKKIVVYTNSEELANMIAEKVNGNNGSQQCQFGVMCRAKKASVYSLEKTPQEMQVISQGHHNAAVPIVLLFVTIVGMMIN